MLAGDNDHESSRFAKFERVSRESHRTSWLLAASLTFHGTVLHKVHPHLYVNKPFRLCVQIPCEENTVNLQNNGHALLMVVD